MKPTFFTPGPAQLYPTAIKHYNEAFRTHVASISHRSQEFEGIYRVAASGLRQLLAIPEDYHVLVVGSGTQAMERTIQNCVQARSLHLVNGAFSERFFATAQELGKQPSKVQVPAGEGFTMADITVPLGAELICLTQNETSTGTAIPTSMIHQLSQANPKTLIAVDIVSAAPYVDLDYRLVDVAFFSVQKGFGLPAGLGIMIVSPRAIQRAEQLQHQGTSIGSYHAFPSAARLAGKRQTPETPPVLSLYVLGKVVHDMLGVTATTMRAETKAKAKLLYDFLDNHCTVSAFVQDSAVRSQTVVAVQVGSQQAQLKTYLERKGLVVGDGYGPYKDTQIRIANFPAHTKADMQRLIRALQDFALTG